MCAASAQNRVGEGRHLREVAAFRPVTPPVDTRIDLADASTWVLTWE